ncbi:MAG: aminotransferase class V-fold PLP-dependent enzyme [Bacteroidetes bacterium]|nr:aminotransferase class V-fold PLP-dependent enzyme [Bacteroidota bacterium]MBX7237850.1 aminotransferase class V-fold PLP-dependent enzyme [Bacteroidia bacterium]MCW5918242.1 aminotransferase class V-fold PLP-dependent enzyme [Bacteroidota bacterium]HMU76863.1 aminotransferase class V-fold PLP-dependent enzyme [Bacteroidia bacterium]HMX96835.1 aminotransferase class V-fold PLP-dependent enzyme [Bacteroidia bacterium]
MDAIYLDYNATTPVDDRVFEKMLPYFSQKFGNAASNTHAFGWAAKEAVEIAREKAAALIGCEPRELYFTSGATEGINLIIKGVYESYSKKGKHIVTYATEHKAVLDTCKYLQTIGADVEVLPVERDGLPDLDLLKKSLRSDTILVMAMFANNETGVLFPIAAMGEICRNHDVIFFSDTTQAAGKVLFDVKECKIDCCVISAHKMYGPKGVGAVYISRKNPRVSVQVQMHGGGHEGGIRSGTLNVPGIVGLGEACHIAEKEMWDNGILLSSLRTRLEQQLETVESVMINGSIKNRLNNTTNLTFKTIRSEDLIKEIRPIAIAAGSACTAALPQPSHVLLAMGLTEKEAYNSVRFSLGKYTTAQEVELTIEKIRKIISSKI